MTARKHAHSVRPTITTDPRDVFETPCLGSWEIYDALIDSKRLETVKYARQKAIELCATCPIQPQCFRTNRDEAWVQVLAGERPPSDNKWGRELRERGELS